MAKFINSCSQFAYSSLCRFVINTFQTCRRLQTGLGGSTALVSCFSECVQRTDRSSSSSTGKLARNAGSQPCPGLRSHRDVPGDACAYLSQRRAREKLPEVPQGQREHLSPKSCCLLLSLEHSSSLLGSKPGEGRTPCLAPLFLLLQLPVQFLLLPHGMALLSVCPQSSLPHSGAPSIARAHLSPQLLTFRLPSWSPGSR